MATDITLTNIMGDSDGKGYFANSISNATKQLSSHTPGDGSTHSLRIIPSAAGECTLTSTSKALVASHKYYLTFKVKFEAAISCTFDWYWPIAEPAAVTGLAASAAADEWIRLSAVFTRESFTDGNYPCRWDFNNESISVAIRFTSCMLFDLTAAFGAGKEPSKEWMDEHVTAYADSQTVSYYENLGELFTDIANALRAKNGQTGEIFACDFPAKIRAL